MATLPLRIGGFGLRNPTIVTHCARLAAAVNVYELAVETGADEAFLVWEREKAVSVYGEPRPHRATRTAASKRFAKATDNATTLANCSSTPEHCRTNNKSLPGVADDSSCNCLVCLRATCQSAGTIGIRCCYAEKPGSQAASRALSPVRCGYTAGPQGLHAITCLRSGFITKDHNFYRTHTNKKTMLKINNIKKKTMLNSQQGDCGRDIFLLRYDLNGLVFVRFGLSTGRKWSPLTHHNDFDRCPEPKQDSL